MWILNTAGTPKEGSQLNVIELGNWPIRMIIKMMLRHWLFIIIQISPPTKIVQYKVTEVHLKHQAKQSKGVSFFSNLFVMEQISGVNESCHL